MPFFAFKFRRSKMGVALKVTKIFIRRSTTSENGQGQEEKLCLNTEDCKKGDKE